MGSDCRGHFHGFQPLSTFDLEGSSKAHDGAPDRSNASTLQKGCDQTWDVWMRTPPAASLRTSEEKPIRVIYFHIFSAFLTRMFNRNMSVCLSNFSFWVQ